MEKGIDRLRNLLPRVTYKPGSEFQITDSNGLYFRDHERMYHLQLLRIVPDVNNPAADTQVTYTQTVTAYSLDQLDEEAMLRMLFFTIRQLELHEMDEWFKLDGKCVNDPHPELRPNSLK